IEVGVRLLLAGELDVRAHRVPAGLLRAAVGRLHEPGPSAGHHGEARLGEPPADLPCEVVIGVPLAEARGPEHRHAGADEVQLAEATHALPEDVQRLTELCPTRARALQELPLRVAPGALAPLGAGCGRRQRRRGSVVVGHGRPGSMPERSPPMSTAKHFDLAQGARQAMLDAQFLPEIPAAAQAEAARLQPASPSGPGVKDLRSLPWSSIDTDGSRDLDQIEVAEELPNKHVRVLVGIADVDALVHRGSALDAYAAHNTCTIYTGAKIFPMLPESLSTDHTSLGEGGERLALVVEMDVDPEGAAVKDHAKLAYDSVGAWLEGSGPAPAKVGPSPVLQSQLRLQDAAAQCLKKLRYERGALDLETIE